MVQSGISSGMHLKHTPAVVCCNKHTVLERDHGPAEV